MKQLAAFLSTILMGLSALAEPPVMPPAEQGGSSTYVGFTPDDADQWGTTPANVDEALEDIVDQRMVHLATTFGAKGDGETNDTEAIQDCIDASAEDKLPCYLPCGIYDAGVIGGNFNGLRIEDDGVSLIGAGVGCVEINADASTQDTGGWFLLSACNVARGTTCGDATTELRNIKIGGLKLIDNNPEDHCDTSYDSASEDCIGEESHGLLVHGVENYEIGPLIVSGFGDEGFQISDIDGEFGYGIVNELECDGHPGIAVGGACFNLSAGNVIVNEFRCHGARNAPVGTCTDPDGCQNQGTCVNIEAHYGPMEAITFDNPRIWDNQGNKFQAVKSRQQDDGRHRNIIFNNPQIDHEAADVITWLAEGENLTASTTGNVDTHTSVADLSGFVHYENTHCTGAGVPDACCTAQNEGTCQPFCTGSGTPFSCCTAADTGTCVIARIDDEEMIISYFDANTITIAERGILGTTAAAHDEMTTIYTAFYDANCSSTTSVSPNRCAFQLIGSNGIDGFNIVGGFINGTVLFPQETSNATISGTTITGRQGRGLVIGGNNIRILDTTVRMFIGKALQHLGGNDPWIHRSKFLYTSHDEKVLDFYGVGLEFPDLSMRNNYVKPRSTSQEILYASYFGPGEIVDNTFVGGCSNASTCVYGNVNKFMGNAFRDTVGSASGVLRIQPRGPSVYTDNTFENTADLAIDLRGSWVTLMRNHFIGVDYNAATPQAIDENGANTYNNNRCDNNDAKGREIIIGYGAANGGGELTGSITVGDAVEWPAPGYAETGRVLWRDNGADLVGILPDNADADIIDDDDEVRKTGGGWDIVDAQVTCANCQLGLEGATISCTATGSSNTGNTLSPPP